MVLRIEAKQDLDVTPPAGDDGLAKPDNNTSPKDQANEPMAEGRNDIRPDLETGTEQAEGILHILTED